ncbi:glycoside hydrolase family 25 [Methylobacterium sp. 4-46]|uniref:glycoside hydrolase family 25 protein n=1 Tax=unclassified Methylobacterium TaxID=2615210 RepID=UPI000152D18E|nr:MULTISPECIES: GH25 family lysozyme [Methylobacterium]ACA19680.1 glycoside hydrolase family 25 [Methylobacterium sp. 4-46]WFT78877.1 GH25 family lysozyme [Methylobacterium nodulans]
MPLESNPTSLATHGSAWLKRLAVGLTLALLGACAGSTDFYPTKGDVKPHPGVARAKQRPIQGIDVSKWQGPIDWASVRTAGTQFAYIKATEGGDHLDDRFRENWAGAARAGVPRGAYHFVYWCRSPEEQMAWFKRNVPNDPTALPPVLDVEWNGHSTSCPKKLPKPQALAMTQTMLREMEAYTGKRPIIYTDITFHRDVLEGELPDYPHWVRSTAAEPEQRFANRDWMLWQFTSTGRVPGVQGDVDRNAFYGSPSEWASFLATDCDPRYHRRLSAAGLCTEK